MTIVHLPPDSSSDEVHHVLARDGAVIIDRLAAPELLDAITAEMQPHIDATPGGSDDFAGRNTQRTGGLVARSPSSRELITHPLVTAVAGLLLERSSNFQLHLTQVISIGPDSPAQPLHRDEWAFDFFEFPSDHHVQCNTIWALTDFTEENGATQLVPGSQAAPRRDAREAVGEPAVMQRGSCLVYTGKVFHGGGHNRSTETRIGLNLTYCAGWVRQEENQYLSCPPDIAATLDDDLLRLMGYRIGAYALGYIDDVRDPLEAIRGSTGSMSFGTR